MPSIRAQYNQEVLEGHREALAALRDLLATETDRTERRRLANAILKARKVEDPEDEAEPLGHASRSDANSVSPDRSRPSPRHEVGPASLPAAPRATHAEEPSRTTREAARSSA